jgi:ABC-type branched-subunit amino acid transport system ATPase component/predicted MFS family arabinose efflux permease
VSEAVKSNEADTQKVHAGSNPLTRWLYSITGGAAVYPLLVLFALNAVDELDRTAFGILLPEIRDEFGLDLQGALSLIGLIGGIALILQVPIAHYADRAPRVRLALVGAAAWAMFSIGTGVAWTVWFLVVMRSGSGIGKAVVDPTHNSLLADYYAPAHRSKVYSFHRAANAVGAFIGPLVAGLLAYSFSWRTPFFVFAIPTFIVIILGMKLRDPNRGAQERRAMGASEEAISTEEAAPSLGESWRLCSNIESLRRIWWSLPFLAASLIGFASLAGVFYDEVYGLDERARGLIAASVEPVQLVGLVIGARVGTKLVQRDPGLILRFLGKLSFFNAAMFAVFALSPWLWLGIVANAIVTGVLAAIGPGIYASLAMAIPPRARATGFSIGSLWVLPGLLILPVIGAIGDAWGIRQGMLMMLPIFIIGGLIIGSAGNVIGEDIKQVWSTAAARSEVAYERSQGRSKLLLVRGLNVSYGNVQVLFDVDLEIDEGEIVALLGTNGAGKSTLLKAISGIVEAHRGTIIFDGTEMTHTPPAEIASRGVMQVPGGVGTFPSLTIGENLQTAAWLNRSNKAEVKAAMARVYEMFPILGERKNQPAANLSGGQQQMLALSMAFLTKPRLLMIDELSLGLAPVVVEQLLPVLRDIKEQGTTIILVEQSVNVALTVAETGYFMEKGEIKFSGATEELLNRPDLLRSVFLEGASKVVNGDSAPTESNGKTTVREKRERAEGVALETSGLTRAFGGIRAVDDVSLQIAPGEIVGVMGPNGAGKTTLFDIISGFTPHDAGRITLAGYDISTMSPNKRALRGLGRSFQDAKLFPAMTVEEALAVSLERFVEQRDPVTAALHLPMSYDSETHVYKRVDELIELLGLESFRSKFLRELSTGSRRIVDLACVVAHRPTVILFDEPSSGIAQRETEALAPLLLRIREGLGAALLVIEHDMPLLSSVADRMIAMEQGRVIAEGDPDEVLRHPAVVASYLGTNADVLARSGERAST